MQSLACLELSLSALCVAGDGPGLLADGGGAQRDDHGETLGPGLSVLAVLAS